jgi:hypothetical protein
MISVRRVGNVGALATVERERGKKERENKRGRKRKKLENRMIVIPLNLLAC